MSAIEGVGPEIIFSILVEVETEIRNNGTCKNERALLFHQLGTIHGLRGDKSQQEIAWQQAHELDPSSEMIRESLKSLE